MEDLLAFIAQQAVTTGGWLLGGKVLDKYRMWRYGINAEEYGELKEEYGRQMEIHKKDPRSFSPDLCDLLRKYQDYKYG